MDSKSAVRGPKGSPGISIRVLSFQGIHRKAGQQEALPPTAGRRTPVGGGEGIRTPDLLVANEALYQLSYTPNRGHGLLVRDGPIAINFLRLSHPVAGPTHIPKTSQSHLFQILHSKIPRNSGGLNGIVLPFMLLAAAAFSINTRKWLVLTP